jgi:hypothetical protein
MRQILGIEMEMDGWGIKAQKRRVMDERMGWVGGQLSGWKEGWTQVESMNWNWQQRGERGMGRELREDYVMMMKVEMENENFDEGNN